MDVNAAGAAGASSASAAINAGSAAGVAILSSAEQVIAAQVGVLFSSLGLGNNVNALA